MSTHYSATVEGAEAVLRQLHELYGKYKFLESRIVQQKRSLLSKLPEIESALKTLNYLEKTEGKTAETFFELADAIYCKAQIEKNNKVMLWLGANVMVEYTYEDARKLLEQNLKGAQETLKSLNTDLEFLKDQITVSEVNISRTHNYQVKLREQARKQAGKGEDK